MSEFSLHEAQFQQAMENLGIRPIAGSPRAIAVFDYSTVRCSLFYRSVFVHDPCNSAPWKE